MFFPGGQVRRWDEPTLDIKVIVRPLDALRFSPWARYRLVTLGKLMPVADWTGPDLRRLRVIAPDHDRSFAVFRDCEVREVAERAHFFGAVPDRAMRVVGKD